MSKKIAFKTLGCRLNQFETDSIATDFHKAGYQVVDFSEKADVYVVNTCTVTNQSDKRSKYQINQAVKKTNDNALVVVTGCMVTSQKEYLESREDLTYVVDNKKKSSVFPLVDAHFRGEVLHPADLKQDLFNFTVAEKGFHTRSMIKVQDGCNNVCSYCIVPRVRGRATSRPAGDVLNNIKSVVDLGFKEVVITGVNISRYDYNGLNFEGLLEQILNLDGDFRVRISSIEPEGFTDRFVELFQHPKLTPHLHLCLQSGSDEVLKRMRRFYSIADYRKLIDQFRASYSDFNFTTDIIVGFPGETEFEFQESTKLTREVGFSHIHTFKYSIRKGTIAEKMDNHIDEKLKNERSEIIRQISDENKLRYRQLFLGKKQTMLIEKPDAKIGAKGYGEHFIPIVLPNTPVERNTFQQVKVVEVLDDEDRTVKAELLNL